MDRHSDLKKLLDEKIPEAKENGIGEEKLREIFDGNDSATLRGLFEAGKKNLIAKIHRVEEYGEVFTEDQAEL
jgi:hypothetical protein